jgi:hypothetical protein
LGPHQQLCKTKINVLQAETIKPEFKTVNIKTANRINCSVVPGSRYIVAITFQYIKNITYFTVPLMAYALFRGQLVTRNFYRFSQDTVENTINKKIFGPPPTAMQDKNKRTAGRNNKTRIQNH